jgi:hypothetical protein
MNAALVGVAFTAALIIFAVCVGILIDRLLEWFERDQP